MKIQELLEMLKAPSEIAAKGRYSDAKRRASRLTGVLHVQQRTQGDFKDVETTIRHGSARNILKRAFGDDVAKRQHANAITIKNRQMKRWLNGGDLKK